MNHAKGPELLIDLFDKTAALLREKGSLRNEQAVELARAIVDMIRKDLGGTSQYIPKGCALDIEDRDLRMWAEFDGHNHEELARRYNLTVPHVYARLKAVRSAMVARSQSDLFAG